jgi:hypothetical protein
MPVTIYIYTILRTVVQTTVYEVWNNVEIIINSYSLINQSAASKQWTDHQCLLANQWKIIYPDSRINY